MNRLQKQSVNAFQKNILTWYETNKRVLPWRRTRDPYKILVSEVMSQQTQLSRVIPRYEVWIKEFPTVEALARATNTDVLRLWSGLGYNRRALYLKKAAETIVQHYHGFFPKEIAQLKKLPGVGEYTARAIVCFAFNQQVAVVDTNVKKVILTQFPISNSKLQMTSKELQDIANQLLPKRKAYEWNQALMDYAAAMLKEEKIPIPKQEKFVGSNRYYRGKIIKLLLEQGEIAVSHAARLLAYDPVTAKASVESIIAGMVKDNLIKKENGKLLLA